MTTSKQALTIVKNDALAALVPAASTVLATATKQTSISPIPEEVLGDDGRAAVDAALSQLDPATLKLEQVILLGADAQQALGNHISILLGQVSQQDAPVLYELLEKLQGGLKQANLAELETKVRKGQEPGWMILAWEKIRGLDSTKRMKKVADQVRVMLGVKSKTLLDLVNGMEAKAREEMIRLVQNLSMLDQLAQAYLQSVQSFGIATAVTYELLTKVRAHEQQLVARTNKTADPQDISAARNYAVLVEQLQNRALTLRTAYEAVPGELEIVSIAKGAAATTLAETANGLRQEFNDMKSALVKWYVLLSIQDMQLGNTRRREIAAMLRNHNVTVLEQVSTKAATMQADNRLEDAQLLLGIGKGLETLRGKIAALADDRKRKFGEAETALNEARQIFTALPAPGQSTS